MRLLLEQDEVIRFGRVRRGVGVRCEQGALWLTQQGDPRDYVLRPGDGHTAQGRGVIVVWASEPSAVRLDAPPRGAPLQVSWGEALRGGQRRLAW